MGCVEWRALKKGILEIIATLPQPDPSPTTGTTATQGTTDRLKWKSSTAAFVHIFNTLAAGGYFDLPTKGGKGNDPNTAAFARMLLQAFDVPGKDGNPITSEVLRVRLADGAPGQLLWHSKQLCGSWTISTRVIFRVQPVRAAVNVASATRTSIHLNTAIAVSSFD